MSGAEQVRQAKMIEELRGFIKKVLQDPTIPKKAMDIARELRSEADAKKKIAEHISAETNLRIPEDWSEADEMFIDVVLEVLHDDMPLY